MTEIKFFNNNEILLQEVLNSIKDAKKNIYIETYRYNKDKFGNLLKKELYEKAKQGVEVKLIIDSWGSNVGYKFFKPLKKVGVEIRFFKEFINYLRSFLHYHKRNHRKMIIIDKKIVYIGSSNIKYDQWRESNIKIKNNSLASSFQKIFIQDFENYKGFITYVKIGKEYIQSIKNNDFEIIRDVPSPIKYKISLKKYCSLIESAKKEIIIETPYFLPPKKLRSALIKASKKQINIKIILPQYSDVKFVDILRRRYIRRLLKYKNIEIYFYKKSLHSKILIIDDKIVIGSVNLDYRSFYLQYEISLILKNFELLKKIKTDNEMIIKDSIRITKKYLKETNFFHKMMSSFLRKMEPLF